MSPSFNRRGATVLTCLEGGGGRKQFWTRDFPILFYQSVKKGRVT